MNRIQVNGLGLWQFNTLRKEPGVQHFVTERSPEERSARKEFTLSYSSSPNREEIHINRSLFAAALGVPDDRLYFPSQVHQTRVLKVSSATLKEELLETDALITNEKELGIAVLAADCVPILLYDRKNKAVGAVHSGWRGTLAKILQKTLQEMNSAFGTESKDLLACIGPSVCQESYEVGEEVVSRFKEEYGHESGLMIHLPENKAKLDLWKANKMQLLAFGVEEHQIEMPGLCTVKNNQYFFSARRGDSGRFAAGIRLL